MENHNDISAVPLDWREFCIPKKSGGVRHLCAPNDTLKEVQRKYLRRLLILSRVVPELKPTAFAHGFVPHRNVMSSIRRHRPDSPLYMCMDIKDFFDNMPVGYVKEVLMKSGLNPSFVDNIITLASYKGRFPQGGPLSPMLMNIGMRETDMMISAYAKEHGFEYTRYADDIMLSYKGDSIEKGKKFGYIFHGVNALLKVKLGLRLSWKKCHQIWRNARYAPRQCLGAILRMDGRGYNAPRKFRRRVRAGVHNLWCVLQRRPATDGDRATWRKLRGAIVWMDYVRSFSSDGCNGADPVINEEKFKFLDRLLYVRRKH